MSATFWSTYFINDSRLSVIKSCTLATRSGCWASPVKFLDGDTLHETGSYQLLSDGTAINYRRVAANGDAQFYIDLNGKKSPNIVGKDVFYMLFKSATGKLVSYDNGQSISYMLTNSEWGMCNTLDGNEKGNACGTVIIKSGWDMPEGYPW